MLAEEWARRLGTINYEITCGISARVPREYHRDGVAAMSAAAPLEAARAVFAGRDAWIVGGAVRDRLLGRATTDLDLALPDDPADAARALARTTRRRSLPALRRVRRLARRRPAATPGTSTS